MIVSIRGITHWSHLFFLGEGTGGLISRSKEGVGVRVPWLRAGSGVKVNASLEVIKLSDMLNSLPGILQREAKNQYKIK